jgi:hypothetical protein
MSKKKRAKLPPGTWIERDMFNSQAFWALKGKAPQLLIRFLGKRQRGMITDRKGKKHYQWINLNSLTMTYKELENIWEEPFTKKVSGLTQPTATRAIDALLAKGFIKIIHPGGAYQQDKTIYALDDSWKLWSPGRVINKRSRDVKRGFQGNKKTRKVIELAVK